MNKRQPGVERYWCIDPGETMGTCVLEMHDERPEILEWVDVPAKSEDTHGDFCRWFLSRMQHIGPTNIVVEDYRIYPHKKDMHIGVVLFTPKQIAAIETLAAIVTPPIPVTLLPAQKKERFPIKRLKVVFPEYIDVSYGSHSRDALLLGLAYLEKAKVWKVEVPSG